MPNNRVLSTRTLLVCAAIGVATGLVSAAWAGLHILVLAIGAVPLYGLVLGFTFSPASSLSRRFARHGSLSSPTRSLR
ncbi:hypothetical protein [Microbacterium sp. CH12i]|uniref:hypothetical protein n=1 Tax=Microbacterium sp. CH12i TaxID=1479651 RepID=UPI000A62BE4B